MSKLGWYYEMQKWNIVKILTLIKNNCLLLGLCVKADSESVMLALEPNKQSVQGEQFESFAT